MNLASGLRGKLATVLRDSASFGLLSVKGKENPPGNCWPNRSGVSSCLSMTMSSSDEIVAADRKLAGRPNLRNRRCCFAGAIVQTGFNERLQDGQRQDLMRGINAIVQRQRHIRVTAQRAQPLAVLIDKAAELPGRQFEFNQSKCRFGPRTGLDQLIDSGGFPGLAKNPGATAAPCGDLREQDCTGRGCAAKSVAQPIEQKLKICRKRHGAILDVGGRRL